VPDPHESASRQVDSIQDGGERRIVEEIQQEPLARRPVSIARPELREIDSDRTRSDARAIRRRRLVRRRAPSSVEEKGRGLLRQQSGTAGKA
jgi:hypothetical protein